MIPNKSSIKDAIIFAISIFLFNMIIGTVTNYYSGPDGIYSINYFEIDNKDIHIINFENIKKKVHDEIRFLIKGPDEFSISTEGVFNYEKNYFKSDSLQSLLIIRDVLPEIQNKIKITGLISDSEITLVEDSQYKYVSVQYLASNQLGKFKTAIFTSIFNSIILVIFYLALQYMTKMQFEKTNNRIAELLLENNKSQKDLSDVNKEFKRIKSDLKNAEKRLGVQNNMHQKCKLYYLSIIRHYRTELEFWRTFISRIIYEDKSIKPKEVFDKITDTLKTFGTRDKDAREGFDLAWFMKKMMDADINKDEELE